RNDNVIAHDDVVSDMAAGKDIVVGSDLRHFAIRSGAMNGDSFPDRIEITYLDPSQPAFPLQILCFQADRGKGINLIPAAQAHVPINHYMTVQSAFRPKRHIFPNNTIRPDV